MDPKIEAVLEKIAREADEVLQDRLLSLYLYGSAVTGEYLPGRSDLNLLFLLRRVEVETLEELQKPLRRWRKQGVGFSLILDPEDLARSLDSFPLEFLEIKIAHRLLSGEDQVSGLVIDPGALRLQCEREIKGKLIQLQRGYLELGADRAGRETLFRESIKAVVIVMRAMLWQEGVEPLPLPSGEVIAGIEAKLGQRLPHCRQALAFRAGRPRLAPPEARALFGGYLAEVKELSGWIDRYSPRTAKP
jgi:predicted nucleotidyltransferase